MSYLIPLLWLGGSVILDLIANWALVKSKGFTVWRWAVVAVLFISAALACMAQAILIIPLAVAYALWSVFGILGTVLIGKCCFKQHLSRQKLIAVTLLATGIVMMNLA